MQAAAVVNSSVRAPPRIVTGPLPPRNARTAWALASVVTSAHRRLEPLGDRRGQPAHPGQTAGLGHHRQLREDLIGGELGVAAQAEDRRAGPAPPPPPAARPAASMIASQSGLRSPGSSPCASTSPPTSTSTSRSQSSVVDRRLQAGGDRRRAAVQGDQHGRPGPGTPPYATRRTACPTPGSGSADRPAALPRPAAGRPRSRPRCGVRAADRSAGAPSSGLRRSARIRRSSAACSAVASAPTTSPPPPMPITSGRRAARSIASASQPPVRSGPASVIADHHRGVDHAAAADDPAARPSRDHACAARPAPACGTRSRRRAWRDRPPLSSSSSSGVQ